MKNEERVQKLESELEERYRAHPRSNLTQTFRKYLETKYKSRRESNEPRSPTYPIGLGDPITLAVRRVRRRLRRYGLLR